MSMNQPPFSNNEQLSGLPKKVKMTNQPTSTATTNGYWDNSAQPQPLAHAASPMDNFNPSGSGNNMHDSAQPLPRNNLMLSVSDQANWSNQRSGNPGSGQLDSLRTPTEQLGGYSTGQLGSPTGQLGDYNGDTGMLKLNQVVKVVRMPVPGRPGEFKTGILPVLPPSQTGALPPPANNIFINKAKNNVKLIALVGGLIFLILLGSGGYYLLHSASASPSIAKSTRPTSSASKINVQATSTVMTQMTATAIANATLYSDPLSDNIHDWTTGDVNSTTFTFANGAYDIRVDNNSSYFGYSYVIPSNIPTSYTYNLTMQNKSYDISGKYSFYCMLFNYKAYPGNKATFYLFRVNNGVNGGKNITYEFDKFDSLHNPDPTNKSSYAQLFPDPNNVPGDGKGNGREFHGQSQPNTYSVEDNNGNFTLSVNGTKIGTVKDTSLAIGGFGMGVNQAKSEVAFSNLSILHN